MIKYIQTDQGRFFTGLGDSILLAWFAEGARDTDKPITLVTGGGPRQLLLEALQVPFVNQAENALIPSECYTLELQDNCRLGRYQYVADFLNITTPLKRPVASVPDQLKDWAKEQRAKVAGKDPFIVLYPQTHWKPREWPQNYWLQLGLSLKQQGLRPIFMIEGKDERYINSPTIAYWGFSLLHNIALMMEADIIVGNDSMPAHLAGTLGKRTIALMGPTKPNVFAHIPDVQCVQSKRLACTGCHFAPPFNMACDVGCGSLYSILVDDVVAQVKANL